MFPRLQYLHLQGNALSVQPESKAAPAPLAESWTRYDAPTPFPQLVALTLYPGNGLICSLPDFSDGGSGHLEVNRGEALGGCAALLQGRAGMPGGWMAPLPCAVGPPACLRAQQAPATPMRLAQPALGTSQERLHFTEPASLHTERASGPDPNPAHCPSPTLADATFAVVDEDESSAITADNPHPCPSPDADNPPTITSFTVDPATNTARLAWEPPAAFANLVYGYRCAGAQVPLSLFAPIMNQKHVTKHCVFIWMWQTPAMALTSPAQKQPALLSFWPPSLCGPGFRSRAPLLTPLTRCFFLSLLQGLPVSLRPLVGRLGGRARLGGQAVPHLPRR